MEIYSTVEEQFILIIFIRNVCVSSYGVMTASRAENTWIVWGEILPTILVKNAPDLLFCIWENKFLCSNFMSLQYLHLPHTCYAF